jgi:FkbM family methyltransferase
MKKISKLIAISRVPRYLSALLRHGVAASVEHREALGSLNLRTVVDVGANRGQFSLFVLYTFPAAKIVALEPLSAPARRFERIFANEPRMTFHNAALAPTSGISAMHVSGHDDSSSLLPITENQNRLFRGTAEVGTEEVRTGPLSDFVDARSIEGPALLKLDVQGYELEALRACGDLLTKFEYISAEGSFIELYEGQVMADELVQWLNDVGYRIVRQYGQVRDDTGRLIQAEMIFSRCD